jgi:hypothetical protein
VGQGDGGEPWREHIGALGPNHYCRGHAGVHSDNGRRNSIFLCQFHGLFVLLQMGRLHLIRLWAVVGEMRDALPLGCCDLGVPSDIVAFVIRCMWLSLKVCKNKSISTTRSNTIFRVFAFFSIYGEYGGSEQLSLCSIDSNN